MNMQRDPRWGRNQEVPGEDPELTGQCTLPNLLTREKKIGR